MAPLGVIAVIGGVLSILAYSRRPAKSIRVNCQFVLSLLSFSLLWFATSSPFAAKGMVSLPDHMISHILTMFLSLWASSGLATSARCGGSSRRSHVGGFFAGGISSERGTCRGGFFIP